MLRRSPKERFLTRVAFYSAVIALVWIMEKVADAQKDAPPAPPVHGFVTSPTGK